MASVPKAKAPRAATTAVPPSEVLTLAEAAAYLRVAEDIVRQLADEQAIPARKVGDDWRILKSALQDWLSPPAKNGGSPKKSWSSLAGTCSDDSTIDDMMRDIYQARGRSKTEIDEPMRELQKARTESRSENDP